jgi:heptosyltransferase-2
VGETEVVAPQSIEELNASLREGGVFIGNDSGPGHLAALNGIPTFTLFGSAVPEWFAPLHPAAEWLIKPCPYRPCWNYCRFPAPNCILDIDEEWAWTRVLQFLGKHMPRALGHGSEDMRNP